MLTAKEKYNIECARYQKLEDELTKCETKIYSLLKEYQEVCKHLNTRKQFWEDHHKNEYGTSIYCDDCNKYLREE